MKRLFLILIIFLLACSEGTKNKIVEDKAEDLSPQKEQLNYSIELLPTEPKGNSYMELRLNNIEPEKALIEWSVNGRVAEKGILRFSTEGLKRGDIVKVKVEMNGQVIFLKELRIKNTPPILKRVKLMPEVFMPEDRFYIDAEATDPDEDPVTILYEWTINDEPAGKEKTIQGVVRRGDRISVKITPFDGEDYGAPVILRREIANIPPMIVDCKDRYFDGKLFTCQILASDLDGDPLTYSLKTAPTDMIIDPERGLIKWNVPNDFKGKVPVTIVVSDGHGGEVVQNFELKIQ